jgi:hypothetical protein
VSDDTIQERLEDAKDRRIAELEWELKCLRASYGQAVDPRVAGLEAERDRLRAAGDVLATRLDEADFKGPLDRKVLKQRQRAVRAWLAIAHPNGKGHPE